MTQIDLPPNADVDLACDGSGQPATRNSSNPLTIDGHGGQLRQTCPSSAVLSVTGTGALELDNITITGASAGDAVSVQANVSMFNSTLTDNGGGASLQSNGSVFLSQSSILNGVYAIEALSNITLNQSTIANNTVPQAIGEEATVYTNNAISLTNSTVTQNSAFEGALYGGSVSLTFSTVVDNTTTGGCAPTAVFGASLQRASCISSFGANVNTGGTQQPDFFPRASVIARPNGGFNCNVDPPPASQGYNWDDDGSCQLTAPSDFADAGNPGLGPLGLHGGPTQTLMPGLGSGLVDQIPDGTFPCSISDARFDLIQQVALALVDQRGVTRPQGPACDIGAVEDIQGDAPQPDSVSVTATPNSATEGGADGDFVFTRTGDTASPLPVAYATSGTATPGADYTALPSVTIPAGQTSVAIPVHALQDNISDPNETVIVTLMGSNQYNIATPDTATVTIVEDFCANVPQAPYNDRETFDVHAHAIDCITAFGMAVGFDDGSYGATIPINRAQIASMIARLMRKSGVAMPANVPDAYPGDDGNVHEQDINELAALGEFDDTTGQTGTSFNVSDPTRRDDIAQLLYNAYTIIVGEPLPAGPDAFTDDGTSDNQNAINALANAGVVEGFGDGTYHPSEGVSRAQMASFFVRFMQLLVNAGKLSPTP